MLLALALCANRSPQFSTPAPAVTALSGIVAGSAICSSGGGGFGGSVQVGALTITVNYTITNTSATGYTAALSRGGVFVRNVMLTSTSTSIPLPGCPSGGTNTFTPNGSLTLAIVRSDGVTVSTKNAATANLPPQMGSCP